MLLNTNGPVIWSEQFYVKGCHTNPKNLPFDEVFDDMCPENNFSAVSFYDRYSPSSNAIIGNLWPEAVLQALLEMRTSIENSKPENVRAQYYLDLSQSWRELMITMGNPTLFKLSPPLSPWPSPDGFCVYPQKETINADKST